MPRKKYKNTQVADVVLVVGVSFVTLSAIFLLMVFFPTIKQEITYIASSTQEKARVVVDDIPFEKGIPTIVAADKDFSVVIPKIGANTKVIEDVDPYDETEYQTALKFGVAHALGSSTPEKGGNIFLFAHSSDNFYNANRYNSVFYLMHKLGRDDEVYIIYKGEKYKYKVIDTKLVNAKNIAYLDSASKEDQVTLMTCWPPGTTAKRLIVVAEVAQKIP